MSKDKGTQKAPPRDEKPRSSPPPTTGFIPSLAKQAAIVARVEALMTTCRALEAEIELSRTHAAHLLQAVLKELFSPSSAPWIEAPTARLHTSLGQRPRNGRPQTDEG